MSIRPNDRKKAKTVIDRLRQQCHYLPGKLESGGADRLPRRPDRAAQPPVRGEADRAGTSALEPPSAFALADIDEFKKVNERGIGHTDRR